MITHKDTKEELRTRLRRVLTGCGIEPDLLDFKQLQSAYKMIKVCESRIARIQELEGTIAELKPTKASIAKEAGLKRTTISASHNPALLMIYDSYFPKETESSVPLSQYNELKSQHDELQKRVDSHAVTQTRLFNALEDKKKLESKMRMMANSIKNLTDIINKFKQLHLEETGEELNIDLSKALKGDVDGEEENPMRPIKLNIAPSGIKS